MTDVKATGHAGLFLLGISIVAFGVQGLLFGGLIDGLQPAVPKISGNLILSALNGIMLIAGGSALIWHRSRNWGTIAIAAIFGASLFLLQLPKLLTGQIVLTAWVAPLECLVIAVVAVSVAKPKLVPVARYVCALMLLVFGAVHLKEHVFVGSLVPDWLPLQPQWPWLTGTLMILAATALFIRKFERSMAMAVAVMFLCWVPLVHVARLYHDPASPFEWAFATTAVALAGSLILALSQSENGEPEEGPQPDS